MLSIGDCHMTTRRSCITASWPPRRTRFARAAFAALRRFALGRYKREIRAAIEKYDISDPERQKRIVAQRWK
jgi:hypothetical protein